MTEKIPNIMDRIAVNEEEVKIGDIQYTKLTYHYSVI